MSCTLLHCKDAQEEEAKGTMKRHASGFVLILLAMPMLAPAAWSQGRGKEKHQAAWSNPGAPGVVIVFTSREREIIGDWFLSNRSGLPPGLANRESLPPGLQKHLRRNGTLPPGLQKKLTPLPYALDSRLARLPGDFLRVVIGRDVILLDRRNNAILDVISNVIRDRGENEDGDYEARERRRDNPDPVVYSSRTPSSRTPAPAPVPTPPPAPTRTSASSGIAPAGSTTAQQPFHLKVRTIGALSTETARAGDRFEATLAEPVYENGRLVARKGAQVEGQVVDSDKGGRVKGVASLTVKLLRFQLTSGKLAEVSAEPVVVEANATKGEDATKIALTSGLGAGVGALIGGGKGAAAGTAAGAATGTGVVLATRGDPAVIPSESVLEFAVR